MEEYFLSILEQLKSSSRKQTKKIIALAILAAIITFPTITVSALSKDVTITDGETTTNFRTILSTTEALLSQAGVEVQENDKVERTEPNEKKVNIDIKRAFNVSVFFGGEWHSYVANDGTVADLLKRENISFEGNYLVVPELDVSLAPNMQIVVSKLFNVNISVDGENKTLAAPEGTVANALKFLNITLSPDDIVNVPLEQTVEEGLPIIVDRVEYKEETVTEAVPFATTTKKTDSLQIGETAIEIPGENGEKEVTRRAKFVNGNLAQADTLSEKFFKNPVTQVKLVGTQPKMNGKVVIQDGTITDENGNVYHYNKVITGSCTAYTANPGARTATGAVARRGLVAVNKNQIPYGTKLYVPGYGICTASDTGGAMMNGTTLVDVYMDSESECFRFGRRNLSVYVLA